MKIAVICNEERKAELLSRPPQESADLIFLDKPSFKDGADCYIDLLYEDEPGHLEIWELVRPSLLFINSISDPRKPEGAIRFNGWPGFLGHELIEVAAMEEQKARSTEVFSLLNRKVEWVPDIPGLVSPRVISMIINEAYITLEEKVSDKENIDIAMKLGTNYPLGPFEWAERIGLQRINRLLRILANEDKRYEASPLLAKNINLHE